MKTAASETALNFLAPTASKHSGNESIDRQEAIFILRNECFLRSRKLQVKMINEDVKMCNES